MRKATYHWMDKQVALRKYYKQLQRDTEVTQITVTNHTNDIRKVCLWGANACTPLTNPLELNQAFSKTIVVQNHPQAIAFNPANNLFYCVNQLSDTVSVIDTQGGLITTIPLTIEASDDEGGNGSFLRNAQSVQITSLPGSISPTTVAINTLSTSVDYGTVAVCCSISNEVVFIGVDNTIIRREDAGVRPVDIVFNPIDGCYYTANMVSGTISKICALRRANNLPAVPGVKSLSVNTVNGDLFVHNTEDGRINVYDISGNFKSSVGATDEERIYFAFNPQNRLMYIVFPEGKTILLYDSALPRTIAKIPVTQIPRTIEFNPNDGLMYVGHPDTQSATRINTKNDIIDTVKLSGFTAGMAFSTTATVTAVSNTNANTVTVTGIQKGPTVTVNDEYFEYREDFQHNPTLISHLKIVASGTDRVNALQLIEKSATGKEVCQTISLSNHQSPQNFGNISEVSDIDGDIIDGHSIWCFKINPKQVVTFLIYHKQFEMYSVLPEKSRISTGVQMSKGIPESWLDNLKEEPPNEPAY